jgi:RNA polymerase sigma factor (sigma-70 family)
MTHDGRNTLNIDALYRARWEPTVTWLARMLKNRADAEEVTAEAFTRLAARDSEPQNPEGLLWVISRGIAIDRLRRRDLGIETTCDPETLIWHEENQIGKGRFDGVADLREAESRADLTTALKALDPDDREAWALTELRGLTTREAAAVTGASHMTISRRAERARLTLTKELA